MYVKSLLLVLLGCSMVLATPVQEISAQRVTRSVLGTFANWLHKADQTVDTVFAEVKKPFKKVFDLVLQTSEGVADFGKQKVYQVLDKYYEIKSKSEENLNKVKNQVLENLIGELQKVIDVLSNNTDDETYEKLKEKTQEIAHCGKEALEKLQVQLDQTIKAQREKLEEELKKWESEANAVVSQKL